MRNAAQNFSGQVDAPCGCNGLCESPIAQPSSLFEWIKAILITGVVLIVVAGFIGLFAWNTTSGHSRAPRAASVATMKNVDGMLKAYNLDYGVYPPTLQALVPNYTEKVPIDAWKRPIGYAPLAAGNPHPYMLFSTGPSGEQGAADNIDYWTDVEPLTTK